MKKIINRIKHLELSGNVYYCTDIHGRFDLLEEEMNKAQFNRTRDSLIVGGDSIDRGPLSHLVLDYLDNTYTKMIKGNHEELYIKAFEEDWRGTWTDCFLGNGGLWISRLGKDERREIYDFFIQLPTAIELHLKNEVIGIVHADCGSDWISFKENIQEDRVYQEAIWSRLRYNSQDDSIVKNIDKVLVGHTPTDSGLPEILGNVRFCDLGAVYRGKLGFWKL